METKSKRAKGTTTETGWRRLTSLHYPAPKELLAAEEALEKSQIIMEREDISDDEALEQVIALFKEYGLEVTRIPKAE